MQFSASHYRALVSGRLRGLGPELERGALRIVSLPYGWATRIRNWLYDKGWKPSQNVGVPVVSVGNLTLGGTGKTPCVEYVARFYQQRQQRVAILSRGYRGWGGLNDEALVLRENLPEVPHLQGADRVALARQAVKELRSTVLVLDDGMQHRRLARNLDIVLIDATAPWGHEFLFPRGLLREDTNGLRRAGIVMLTRCDQVEAKECDRILGVIGTLVPEAPVVQTTHRPVELVNSGRKILPLERLNQQPVAAFCGLGNPEAFRRTLVSLGSRVRDFRTFFDHHAYTKADIESLCNWARQQARDCIVVTTQKDLVKINLSELAGHELWALRIRLHVEAGQDALDRKLEGVFHG